MGEQDRHPPSGSAAETRSNSDPITRIVTTELPQLVIVVPDTVKTDPIDLGWIIEHDPFKCRIIRLGKCKAHERFEISDVLYGELLLKLIAAGVRVIHNGSLEETNAKYLEVHPNAEGVSIRRSKPFNIWEAPFRINVPANTVRTMDIAWPADAKEVAAHIDPMDDDGKAWGIGLAVGWPGGEYVQINARADGRWSIRRNGNEHLCGSYPRGKPATVAIRLDHETVRLMAQVDRVTDLLHIAEFPRGEFPGVPGTVRVGKIGRTWDPRDSDSKGTTSICQVDWVRIY